MMPPRWNWRDGLPPVVVVDNVWLHEGWYLNKGLGGVGGGLMYVCREVLSLNL